MSKQAGIRLIIREVGSNPRLQQEYLPFGYWNLEINWEGSFILSHACGTDS